MINSPQGYPGRRAFLGAAAGGAAAGAAAIALPGPAGAAARGPATPGPAARAAGPAPGDWAALARDLSGPLVRPGDASYPTAKLLFDPRFDGQHPAGIAYVKNAQDVSTCLAFVRKFTIPVAARSGGHSYAGWSGTSGLIVDVSGMNTVAVSGATATAGAGTRLIDFYHGLAAYSRAVPGGVCPTVGVAGFTLGGGVGIFSRAYGLTCDNLESVQIVTANGAVLAATADPGQHPGLFWACQGGGGGNFGVATEFAFRTRPAPRPVLFTLSWPWAQAAQVVAGWQSWAPYAPDEMWSKLLLLTGVGARGPAVRVQGACLGSASDTAALLARFEAAVGAPPSDSAVSEPQPYLTAMLTEAGCAATGYPACHLPWYSPGGTRKRQAQFSKSDFFTAALSDPAIGALLAGVAALRTTAGAPGGIGGIQLDSFGGAINRVSPGATAFVHRNALFMAQYTTDWYADATAAEISNQHAWIRSCWASMRPYASGQAYVNYIDPDLINWRQAYYGANYPRLAVIKRGYDPTGLFTFPQAIT